VLTCAVLPPTTPQTGCVVPTTAGMVLEYVVTTRSGDCVNLPAPNGTWVATKLVPQCAASGDGGLRFPFESAVPSFSLPACLYRYFQGKDTHPSMPLDAAGLCTCDTVQISVIPYDPGSGATSCDCCAMK